MKQPTPATLAPIGKAIHDYHQEHCTEKLLVHSSLFEDNELSLSHLFRSFDAMPALEQKALSLSEGNILDIGAGSHALALQAVGKKGRGH